MHVLRRSDGICRDFKLRQNFFGEKRRIRNAVAQTLFVRSGLSRCHSSGANQRDRHFIEKAAAPSQTNQSGVMQIDQQGPGNRAEERVSVRNDHHTFAHGYKS
jgi:hypothetical protein